MTAADVDDDVDVNVMQWLYLTCCYYIFALNALIQSTRIP